MRKCKQCKAEIMAAAKCTDIVEKKGFCSVECLALHAKEKRIKTQQAKDKKEMKAAKERIKTKAQWMREAQAEFNKFIRLRDASEPCISCGRHHQGQYHAGHYRTTAAAPQLRFDEHNNNKQCAPCNSHLSGNIVNYRPGLIEKIGIGQVLELEQNNEIKRWSIAELKEIKERYRAKCREIEKG